MSLCFLISQCDGALRPSAFENPEIWNDRARILKAIKEETNLGTLFNKDFGGLRAVGASLGNNEEYGWDIIQHKKTGKLIGNFYLKNAGSIDILNQEEAQELLKHFESKATESK